MLRVQEAAIKEVREASKRCDADVTAIVATAMTVKRKDGKALWDTADVSGQSYSFAEVLLEAQRVVRSIKGLQWARAGLASAASTSGVSAAFQALEGVLGQIKSGLDTVKSSSRSLRLDDGPVFTYADDGTQLLDVGGLAINLHNQTEALKTTLPTFLLFPRLERDVEAQEMGLLAEKLETLMRSQAQADSALAEIMSARDASNGLQSEVAAAKIAFDREVEELRTQLTQVISEVETSKTKVVEIKDEAASILKEAKTANESLAELLRDAEDKNKAISTFSSELEETKGRLSEIESNAEKTYSKQLEYVDHVEALIEKAEAMVSGATVAGLAKAFADERASLEQGMKGALGFFLLGITSIFLVTLLLAAYVFEIPLHIGDIMLSGPGKTAALGDEITIAGVLSRGIILLAPFWLTLFSARRYRNLFDLRQQYSHKYNMAFSVDGFKQQAPSYQEQIAAWVFHVVAESPVAGKSKGSGMDANPLPTLGDIVKMPGERFSELLKAAVKS